MREIKAIVDYQVAQIDLAFATGTLLGYTRVYLPGGPSLPVDVKMSLDSPVAAPRVGSSGAGTAAGTDPAPLAR